MGVDTKLFISSQYTVQEVKTVIEKSFQTQVIIDTTNDPNYVRLSFSIQGDVRRSLSLFNSYTYNGFSGTLLGLDHSGRAVEIMECLAKVFGGFLQPNDCEESHRGYPGSLSPEDGLSFWIRYAVINGIDHNNVDELKKFIETTRKAWK